MQKHFSQFSAPTLTAAVVGIVTKLLVVLGVVVRPLAVKRYRA